MAFKIDKQITSSHNPLFRGLRESLSGKGIRKHGQFLVFGERAVRETLERFPRLARNLLLCSTRHQGSGSDSDLHPETFSSIASGVAKVREVTSALDHPFSVISLTPELFDELDAAGTRTPILVVRTPEIPESDLSHAPRGIEILCALGDPSNVGALLRSAAAFGATRVILLQESASPFHPKAVRAASASTLGVELQRGPSIQSLPKLINQFGSAFGIVALDMHGERLDQFRWPKDVRLLIGEEGQGIPASTKFQTVAIPMAENVESLNATVASSLALYSYRLRFPLT